MAQDMVARGDISSPNSWRSQRRRPLQSPPPDGTRSPAVSGTFRLQRSQRFGSMEVAVEHSRHQYRISTAKQEAIVRDHLGRVLKEENGSFVLPASSIWVKIRRENRS